MRLLSEKLPTNTAHERFLPRVLQDMPPRAVLEDALVGARATEPQLCLMTLNKVSTPHMVTVGHDSL